MAVIAEFRSAALPSTTGGKVDGTSDKKEEKSTVSKKTTEEGK